MSEEPDSRPKHVSGLSEAEAWYRYLRYPYMLAKLVTFGLLLFGLIGVFRAIEHGLFPVLLALLIAYLLDPAVDKLEERGWSRTSAIMIFLAVGSLATALFLVFLLPTISHKITGATERLPKLAAQVDTVVLPWLQDTLGFTIPSSASAAVAEYRSVIEAQLPGAAKIVSQALSQMVASIGSVASSAINVVIIPLFIFYFLRDFDRMRLAAVEFVPEANRAFILERARRMDLVVGAWFRGQVEVALLLSVLYSVGLAIVFGLTGSGVAIGIAIGVIAGLTNVVPYLGFLIGFSLSVLIVLLDLTGVWGFVGVCSVFAIVQLLEGYVITPHIVGEKVGLSPMVVLIALLFGGEILGLVGFLLALPIAGILRVLLPDFIAYYRATSWFTGKVDLDAELLSFVEIAERAEAARARDASQ